MKYAIRKVFPDDGSGYWDPAAQRYCYWQITTPSGDTWRWVAFRDCLAHIKSGYGL